MIEEDVSNKRWQQEKVCKSKMICAYTYVRLMLFTSDFTIIIYLFKG